MSGNSLGRRSSTNPVRVSMFDKEDRSLTRSDARRTAASKPKVSISTADSSHIPRPRLRATSCDRASTRGSILKATGKTPLHHAPTTPITPIANSAKSSTLPGGSNRIHAGLPTGRRSLSADRASSLGAKGPRKDTRPVADKAYQTYMLSKIDKFLAINNCSSMVNSNGSLKPVTLKMFVEISAYLVKLLDIKQILSISNYVEEVPKIAKKLHYPGIMNKSWLKTANAMHSWSNVLAWICWLVEICEVREIAFQKYSLEDLPFIGNEKEAKMYKHTFFSMLNFYNAWNDEKLEEEAAMVDKYLHEIEEQQGVTEEDLSTVRSELEEEMAKLQAAEENANKVDTEVKHLQEVFSSLQKDETMQLSDISAKEEYIKTINAETEEMNTECNVLQKQISLLNTQRDELLSVIKQQPMSKAEKDKILEKCTEIKNYMHQFDEHLQEIQKELYSMDIKLASINSNLTKSVLTYNKEIFMHLSDNIGVDLEELQMPEKGILHSDTLEVMNAKASLMDDVIESLNTQIVEKERSLELSSNELENLQEKMKILEDESNDITNQIKERKNLIGKMKNDAKSEEAKLKDQIKSVQNDIKGIEELMPNTQQLVTDLEETTEKLETVSRRKSYIEESARLFFDKFYEILGEHRNELHSVLTKLNK